jgi:hypothetical protein
VTFSVAGGMLDRRAERFSDLLSDLQRRLIGAPNDSVIC